jgi:flavodoxin
VSVFAYSFKNRSWDIAAVRFSASGQLLSAIGRKVMEMKTLVVYYTWSNGNTERIARRLAQSCGGDLEALQTAVRYEGSHQDVVEQALEETKKGFTPPLMPLKKKIRDYEVIVIGTPTWWYTMAPAVLSFIRSQDFTGKTVIPFMTNAGWPGHVIKDMTKEIESRGGTVRDPFEVRFDSSGGSQLVTKEREILKWMERIPAIR